MPLSKPARLSEAPRYDWICGNSYKHLAFVVEHLLHSVKDEVQPLRDVGNDDDTTEETGIYFTFSM